MQRRCLVAFIQSHPALCYFALTFVISWGGILIVIAPTGLFGTREEFDRLMPIWSVALVAGPAVAGILLTALVHGTPGLREFRSRLLAWRVRVRWYVVALATAPLYFIAVLLLLSVISSDLLPAILSAEDKATLVRVGLPVGLAAGFFEELGWTGFAVPTLRRRYSVLTTGLILGLVWAAWHFLVKIWSAGAFDLVAFLPADLLQTVVGLTAFRILMVWVYDRTGSLLLAILMHTSLTASTVIVGPVATGGQLASANLVLAIGWWLLIAAAAARSRTMRSRSLSAVRSSRVEGDASDHAQVVAPVTAGDQTAA